ncbi:MAG: ABC transporter permease [Planctomycetota bacterium]
MRLLSSPLRLLLVAYQSVMLAIAQIWSNKLRSVLTTVGIVIGVAAVTAVIAALTGLRQKVLSEFEAIGTNKIFVFPRTTDEMRASGIYRDIRFEIDLFDGLAESAPKLKAFYRNAETQQTVNANGVSTAVSVKGVEPAWHAVENRAVMQGRPFSFVENDRGRPVALINENAQQLFRLPRDPIGQTLTIQSRKYLIIGVVEPAQELALFGGGQDGNQAEVLIPFKALARENAFGGRMFYFIIAAAENPGVAPEAAAQIRYYLRGRRGIDFDEEEDFGVEYIAKFVDQFNQLAVALTAVAGGIVGISLLVGGVGIMNIMLVSVSERTREIGLRKAIGARPTTVLLQFLIEAVVLCLLGGLIGVAGGQLLTLALQQIPNAGIENAYIPTWAIGLAFGFSATTGVVFGMFPAIKASRLDPIVALRHE